MDDFTPIADDFTPATKEQPHDYLSNLWKSATTEKLQNASYADPLADIARAGQYANQKVQNFSNNMAEQAGATSAKFGHSVYLNPDLYSATLLGTAGQAFLPTNRLGAALTALPYVKQAGQAVRKEVGSLGEMLAGSASEGGNLAKNATELAAGQEQAAAIRSAAFGGKAPAGPGVPSGASQVAQESVSSTPNVTDNLNSVKTPRQALLNEEVGKYGVSPAEKNLPQWISDSARQKIENIYSALKAKFGNAPIDDAAETEISKGLDAIGAEHDKIDLLGNMPKQNVPIDELGRPLQQAAQAGEEAASAGQTAYKKPGLIAQGVGQAIRAASGIPTKDATAAASDLQLLGRAKTADQMAQDYQAFEKANNVKGLRQVERENWVDYSGQELKDMVLDAAKKVENNQPINKQDLYVASQASRKLRDLASKGDPDSIKAMSGDLIGQGNQIINDKLEKIMPGYQKLRTDNFESNVAQSFSHLFPQNQNLSPNVLRTTTALGAALAGHPGALFAVSPYAWKGALMAAGAIQNAATNPNVWNLMRQGSIPLANALGNNQ